MTGRESLHRDGEDRAHAPLGVALGLLLDLTQPAGGVVACAVLDVAQQALLGLRGAQSGDPLQRGLLVALTQRELLALGLERPCLLVQLACAPVQLPGTFARALLEPADALLAFCRIRLRGCGVLRSRSGMVPTTAQQGRHQDGRGGHDGRHNDEFHCRSLPRGQRVQAQPRRTSVSMR